MRKFWTSLCLAVACAAIATPRVASGNVLYFSETDPSRIVYTEVPQMEDSGEVDENGDPIFVPTGRMIIDPANNANKPRVTNPGHASDTVPTITVDEGQTVTLHVWFNPTTGAPGRKYTSLAFDVESSTPLAFTTSSMSLANPTVEVGENQTRRWDNTVLEGVNTSATTMVRNAYGFTVQTPPGITNSASASDSDRQRDDITADFYIGTVTFTANAAGRHGLYFRTGAFKTIVENSATGGVNPPDDVWYGNRAIVLPHNGTAVGSGDPMDPTLQFADAIIVVEGGAPARDILRINESPAPAPTHTISGPNGGTPKNVPVGASSGAILVQAWDQGFFDVFFDITPSVGTSMADILAALEGQINNGTPTDGYRVELADGSVDELGFGIDYDIRVLYAVDLGEDVLLDFDFGSLGTVNNVGVPEPSSLILAAIGGVALLGLRRRK